MICQTKSVTKYIIKFTRYISNVEQNNKILQYIYKKKLKKKIKNKIIYYKYHTEVEDQINTLYKLISISIQLDNQLYKYRLEKNLK